MRVPRKKKKKKKLWLYLLVTFLLIVFGITGYIFYELKLKHYDIADPVVDQIIDQNYVVELPDGNQVVIDKEGNILEEVSMTPNEESEPKENNSTQPNASSGNTNQNATTKPNTSAPTTGNAQSQNKPATTKQPNEKPSVASIKEKYLPTLKALEEQANTKINGLLEQAKQEYKTKKSKGESISFGYFYNKYYGAAEKLEKNSDAAFNSIMKIVESEFETSGYSKVHAQSFREEYNSTKEKRKNSLLSKALELF